jgi:hypothetical protein
VEVDLIKAVTDAVQIAMQDENAQYQSYQGCQS